MNPEFLRKQEAQQQLESLRRRIERHDFEYYVEDQSSVPDAEYDRLMRELQALENTYPDLITSNSPSQRVSGTPSAGFEEVVHQVPMLSLANAFDPQEVRDFDRRWTRRW